MDELTTALERRFGLPCACYPPMDNDGPLLSGYRQAKAQGEKEGFWPMLLSEEYARGLLEAPDTPEKLPPVGSGKEFFQVRVDEIRREVEKSGPDGWTQLLGEVAGGEKIDRFLSYWDFRGKKTVPMVLVRVPVQNPWEVFAWLPFGGWNECPGNEEHMAVAKYWFEEYGAFPSLMTCDVLEYSLPSQKPIPRERAKELAVEQFIYCADIVEQGVGTVGCLADSLAQSDHWYFWWD